MQRKVPRAGRGLPEGSGSGNSSRLKIVSRKRAAREGAFHACPPPLSLCIFPVLFSPSWFGVASLQTSLRSEDGRSEQPGMRGSSARGCAPALVKPVGRAVFGVCPQISRMWLPLGVPFLLPPVGAE